MLPANCFLNRRPDRDTGSLDRRRVSVPSHRLRIPPIQSAVSSSPTLRAPPDLKPGNPHLVDDPLSALDHERAKRGGDG